MVYADVYNLSTNAAFQQRVQGALQTYCIATVNAETANDQQTITVTGAPTGGSFTLANGPLTAAVAPAWNWTAQQIQAALDAALATGNSCVCTGGPLPATPVIVTFTGNLAASPQNAMGVSANNLTGGASPAASISHTFGVAQVNHAARAALASKILAAPQQYAQTIAAGVAADATVQTAYGGSNQANVTDAEILAAIGAQFNSYT